MMTEKNMAEKNGDITARLDALKRQIEQGKIEKTRAETNLQTYEKQRDEIVAQMAELGVTPETVDAEIKQLNWEIKDGLRQAEELLEG
jgi:septation ring formation regulator EzrA